MPKPKRSKPAKPAPKRKVARLKLRPGQPDAKSKLDDERLQKICNMIAGGHGYETAAEVNGIDRDTIRIWRIKGQEDPTGPYGRAYTEIEKALHMRKVLLVDKLLKDDDWKAHWKLLKNYYPDEFNERIHLKAEHCGPNGNPIPVDLGANFTVEII